MKKVLLFILTYFLFMTSAYSYEFVAMWTEGMNGQCEGFNSGNISLDGGTNYIYSSSSQSDFYNEVRKYVPGWNGEITNILWGVSPCAYRAEYRTTIEEVKELEGNITFTELEYGGSVSITDYNIPTRPVSAGVFGENPLNNFINNDIEVRLTCTNCDSYKTSSVRVTENGEGSLTIEENGNTLTKKFHVWKINKRLPIGTLTYFPDNNTWTNGSKTVRLNGEATVFGPEGFNRDWIVGTPPTKSCDTEGGCTGTLSIEDSAGNILEKTYEIKNIDKTPPRIHVELYEISGGERKVGVKCEDTGGSGCVSDSEEISWMTLGTSSNKCVSDKAGNSSCMLATISSSISDYSDIDLEWTNGNRTLTLNCRDETGGSGCTQTIYSKTIYVNTGSTSLTATDNAGNTLTKNFEIVKIDKVLPNISISSVFPGISEDPFEIKASDISKINISSNDNLSGIKEVKYNWNSTCVNGNILTGTNINGNEKINYTVTGNHILYACAMDNAGNIKEVSKEITIFPSDLDESKTTISVDSTGNKYANDNDTYDYSITLKDKYENPIYNKDVNILDFSLISGDKTLKYTDGSTALDLHDKVLNSDSNGEISFKVKSLVPGAFTQRFRISMKTWGNTYVDDDPSAQTIVKDLGENTFIQPISGSISIVDGAIPEIGKDQKYEINLLNSGSVNGYSNGKLDISSGSIINTINGHFWKTFEGIDNNFGNSIIANLGFSGSIDANDNILSGVELSTEDLEISYEIGGKGIKYYLDDFELTNSCDLETLGVKVYGTIQGDGKSDITGQESNFSDLSKAELRSKIRMNGYKLIRGMSNGDIVNGIKYVEGDITILGENLGFETLIVKDGNVIISGDLNKSNKKLGIIILKDNYLIDSDYNEVGNIYVNSNVEVINAIIYTDGALRSANSSGVSYSDNVLNTKLTLNGSLFTRNTIGGAVSAGGKYILPGGQKTTDYDLAEIYDLNYVRKVPLSCGVSEDNYSFEIRYNPSIQNNPPKGFGN